LAVKRTIKKQEIVRSYCSEKGLRKPQAFVISISPGTCLNISMVYCPQATLSLSRFAEIKA